MTSDDIARSRLKAHVTSVQFLGTWNLTCDRQIAAAQLQFDSVSKIKTVCNEIVIKMAESKGALIAKSVQKHAGRAKEKVFMVFMYLHSQVSCGRKVFKIATRECESGF